MPNQKEVMVTSPNDTVIAKKNNIFFPTIESWIPLAPEKAKLQSDQAGTPWNPQMASRIREWQTGKEVDLSQGHSLQTYWGPIILLPKENYCSPLLVCTAGLRAHNLYHLLFKPWQAGEYNPIVTLLNQISENLIIRHVNKVGCWRFNGAQLASTQAETYIQHFHLTWDEELDIDLGLYKDTFEDAARFSFGGHYYFSGLPVFYPLDGAILGLVPFRIKNNLPENVQIVAAQKMGPQETNWELHSAGFYNHRLPWPDLAFEAQRAVRAFVSAAEQGE